MTKLVTGIVAISLLGSCFTMDARSTTAHASSTPVSSGGVALRGIDLDEARLVAVRTSGARLRGDAVGRLALIAGQLVVAGSSIETPGDLTGLELIGELADGRNVSVVVASTLAGDRPRYRLLVRDTWGNFTSICSRHYGAFSEDPRGLRFDCPVL